MGIAEKTKRARSNVRAATKQIGVSGVLNSLQIQMHASALQFQDGSFQRKHYMKLHDILQDARYAFVAECEKNDEDARKQAVAA